MASNTLGNSRARRRGETQWFHRHDHRPSEKQAMQHRATYHNSAASTDDARTTSFMTAFMFALPQVSTRAGRPTGC
jgi:hypothetical protein